MKELGQNIGKATGSFETGIKLPVVKEQVIFTPSAQRLLMQAEQAGADTLFLNGILDSLAATAPVTNGQRVISTDQSFQFGLVVADIKGKPVHPGQQKVRPKSIT